MNSTRVFIFMTFLFCPASVSHLNAHALHKRAMWNVMLHSTVAFGSGVMGLIAFSQLLLAEKQIDLPAIIVVLYVAAGILNLSSMALHLKAVSNIRQGKSSFLLCNTNTAKNFLYIPFLLAAAGANLFGTASCGLEACVINNGWWVLWGLLSGALFTSASIHMNHIVEIVHMLINQHVAAQQSSNLLRIVERGGSTMTMIQSRI